jgi:pimeloyl-ACP methyl ester carboxylesterase
MEPIVLIHGYSSESRETTKPAIAAIYGTLPKALRDLFGRDAVVEIDLSRYVSLEDGVTIDDVSRGLDRALQTDFPHLLKGSFHVIIHSTGALVIRNWIRRFSGKPSPIRNLIYLAGANFGSGWAHIGRGQLAKWARYVFQGGAERGVQVLDALELGSDWTLDLHLYFLQRGNTMAGDYKVYEYGITGTQADVRWYQIPISYAKEDGSDGVVRVSASNVNFQYLRFGPTDEAFSLPWSEVQAQAVKHAERRGTRESYYRVKARSLPGAGGRPEAPLSILYQCAHFGDEMGIVTGEKPRAQVLRLIKSALETRPAQWQARLATFQAETDATYNQALASEAPPWWKKWVEEPRAQYDPHAQVIFRIRDQNGRPVSHYDIFFDSVRSKTDPSLPFRDLIEDKHVTELSPNIIVFYLRTDKFSAEEGQWIPQVPRINGCFLEVSAVEPETGEIVYLPMRFEFTGSQLNQWIRGHRTTLVDVELLRLPSPEIYRLIRY